MEICCESKEIIKCNQFLTRKQMLEKYIELVDIKRS